MESNIYIPTGCCIGTWYDLVFSSFELTMQNLDGLGRPNRATIVVQENSDIT